MVRPFDLRDLALVRRLGVHGVSLYTEPALTNSLHPLRGALLSIVGGDLPTYVWKEKKTSAAGFVQLYLEEGNNSHAHILCLGATPAQASADGQVSSVDERVWLPLLEQAIADVGQRGIHSLVAEVSETGDELPILRRAGFAVYTRQDIWVLEKVSDHQHPALLSPRHSVDDWEIQLLYTNTVPRLVQLVEPSPPLQSGNGWVMREDGELTAFVHMCFGAIGTWMRLSIHPRAAERADEIVAAALQVVRTREQRPVYCCVRRYQSWLQAPLERAGYVHWGSQAVMVKHTVKHMQKSLSELSAVLDTQGIPASAPIVQQIHRPQLDRTLNH
ncbi:MAG: hypothetical protein ACE5E7_14850 [Anaerolineae bacterium]